jgi:hypothetical protein
LKGHQPLKVFDFLNSLAHWALLFDEKIRQSVGLDCGMLEFFTHEL